MWSGGGLGGKWLNPFAVHLFPWNYHSIVNQLYFNTKKKKKKKIAIELSSILIFKIKNSSSLMRFLSKTRIILHKRYYLGGFLRVNPLKINKKCKRNCQPRILYPANISFKS